MEKIKFEKEYLKCTPIFLLASQSLFEPRKYDDLDEAVAKYSILMVFDKEKIDISPIQTAIQNCWEKTCLANYKKILPLQRSPLKDGDSEIELAIDPEGRNKGKFTMWASRNADFGRPEIFKKNGLPLNIEFEKDQIYSGIKARASLQFRPYGKSNRLEGVTCNLIGLQKVDDGERLTGLPKCSFDAIEEELDSNSPFASSLDDLL